MGKWDLRTGNFQPGKGAQFQGPGQAQRHTTTPELTDHAAADGKIGLAHYLHEIRRRDSPRCPCAQGIQTVRHVLIECSRTQDLRKKLLGRTHDVRKILKDPALAKSAVILLLRGNLLGQFQDVREVPEDLNPEPPDDPETGGSRTANY